MMRVTARRMNMRDVSSLICSLVNSHYSRFFNFSFFPYCFCGATCAMVSMDWTPLGMTKNTTEMRLSSHQVEERKQATTRQNKPMKDSRVITGNRKHGQLYFWHFTESASWHRAVLTTNNDSNCWRCTQNHSSSNGTLSTRQKAAPRLIGSSLIHKSAVSQLFVTYMPKINQVTDRCDVSLLYRETDDWRGLTTRPSAKGWDQKRMNVFETFHGKQGNELVHIPKKWPVQLNELIRLSFASPQFIGGDLVKMIPLKLYVMTATRTKLTNCCAALQFKPIVITEH